MKSPLDMARLLARFAVVAIATTASGVIAAPIEADAIRVIDGDTIAVRGAKANVRLIGYDAPERAHPQCAAEATRAEEATARLAGLLREGPLDLSLVACSCAPGTEGTGACNYGRSCGVLLSSGRDVGAVLISERLAVPYRCGPHRCPHRTPSWCSQ